MCCCLALKSHCSWLRGCQELLSQIKPLSSEPQASLVPLGASSGEGEAPAGPPRCPGRAAPCACGCAAPRPTRRCCASISTAMWLRPLGGTWCRSTVRRCTAAPRLSRQAVKDAYPINGGIFITVYLCQLGGKLPDVSFAFITQTSLLLSGSVLLSSVSPPEKSSFLLRDVDVCRICLRAVWRATSIETSPCTGQISVPATPAINLVEGERQGAELSASFSLLS